MLREPEGIGDCLLLRFGGQLALEYVKKNLVSERTASASDTYSAAKQHFTAAE